MPRRPRTEKISQKMKSKGRSARGKNTAMPEKAQQSYRPTVTACCTGYICEAVANNFLPLLFLIFQSSLGISLEQLTLLVTVNFMTQKMIVEFAEGADQKATMKAVLKACKKVEPDCAIEL